MGATCRPVEPDLGNASVGIAYLKGKAGPAGGAALIFVWARSTETRGFSVWLIWDRTGMSLANGLTASMSGLNLRYQSKL